ncbi:type II toxin-antitoxin system PemK/MazF family toxin [Acidithiobacillus sulfuriphilus]|uniref:type II toxin-antitoxin system PemK/MazF family toxin n=1 Tax=Acidithiobacillus sulfuriphilus TaxID=1867749 RepID=UPI003F648EC4
MAFDPSTLKRGDVVVVDLAGARGTEKSGNNRACVVVQNDIGNAKSRLTIIAPLTDMKQYKKLPVQVPITAEERGNGGKDSVIECGHLRAIDKSRIAHVVSHLSADVMARVDKALKVSLALG